MDSHILHQEFKTVNEMIYVICKYIYAKKNWTKTQKQEFEERFVENLIRMQQNKKFQKEYMLYEEATAQGKIIVSPQNQRQEKLNEILKEMVAIDLACRPFALDDREIWHKQADTRLKYEKRLRTNEKIKIFFNNKSKDK